MTDGQHPPQPEVVEDEKYICRFKIYFNWSKNPWIGISTSQQNIKNIITYVVTGILTHWGRVTHICVGKLSIIGSDNGLSPKRRQAIIWTNAGILLIGPLGTNFSEILIEIQTFSLKKIRLKMSSAKCCSFRLGLNVLSHASAKILWCSCTAYAEELNFFCTNN